MVKEKKMQRISRRGFLFGGFRKSEDRESLKGAAKPIAACEADLDTLAQANLAYEKERYEEAAEKYREFVKTEPDNADARKRYGHSLYMSGRYVQARVELNRAMKILGKDNFSSLYLGLCFCRMGRGEKVAETWKDYFNPSQVEVQREINLQLAMIETDPETDLCECADMVEKSLCEAVAAAENQVG